MTWTARRSVLMLVSLALAAAATLTFDVLAQQAPPMTASPPAFHARQHRRLIIRNVMVIYGSVRPPYGPVDVVVEDGVIAYIGMPGGRVAGSADAVIDGTGKYVMPGIVNTHMHWHEERQPGMAQPIQYERNLYLAAGVTTAREVGGDFEKSKRWQAESAAHTIISPRILVYPVVSKGRMGTPGEIRAWIRDIHARGADGLKILAMDRDQLEAILDEAHRVGLRTTAHIGAEETTARDYIELGVSSIEHFYGVADAALPGAQRFPADMNYSNEIHRFARAGELYAQADRQKLS
jgi:imidazolonepropionase-like amidohydrolase